ncbi:Sua5/YciO/YrdC/YwlC family protein [Helicobacter sp. MIT 14-3879]|uniref:Sua5/YciO/YrdC/YwlC family protein n=1 Tax=Helicobacter sp. MIT 14-3879 TaxID=2040649 RepID=UPI000E1E38B1|nr:Sua5/YciO/YrdC/YwlC family protein [Helicobacter sp. MIT 14-3879]RDU65426.1 Sua5 YciO YrdC YwlC family protein [Helicobacter sp. MIT 14-3879]
MKKLFLAQSDTTAGFLSKDKNTILKAKNSPKNKRLLIEVSNIALIKQKNRIPNVLNKAIRRANKTTFIFPNKKAFRVIRNSLHLDFLNNLGGMLYSSSANLNKENFCYSFAKNKADIIILDKRGIYEATPSKIFQAKHRIKKIR